MNHSDGKRVPRVPYAVMASVLALSLSACGEKPAPQQPGKGGPQVQQPAKAAEKKREQAGTAASGKAAEAAKANEDTALAAKVKSALMADPALKMLAIDVGASGGVVTLFGTANTAANRDKAARVAADVPGVKSVDNKLVIVAGS